MASIARRAGLSKGGVYHHFASKDAVLAAANERVSEPVALIFEKIAGLASPALMLETYINDYLDYWAANKDKLAFIFVSIAKSMADPTLFQAYDRYITQTVAALAGLYQAGVERGEFAPHDCRARALALCAALDGVTLYLNDRSSLTLAEIKRGYRAVYVDSLRNEA